VLLAICSCKRTSKSLCSKSCPSVCKVFTIFGTSGPNAFYILHSVKASPAVLTTVTVGGIKTSARSSVTARLTASTGSQAAGVLVTLMRIRLFRMNQIRIRPEVFLLVIWTLENFSSTFEQKGQIVSH
jgi:hypothetical protein